MSCGSIHVGTFCIQGVFATMARIAMQIILGSRGAMFFNGLVGFLALFGTRYGAQEVLGVQGYMGRLYIQVNFWDLFGLFYTRAIELGKGAYGLYIMTSRYIRQTSR